MKAKRPIVARNVTAKMLATEAAWDRTLLTVTFADGYLAHVPAEEVLRHGGPEVTSISLAEREPHGITLRFGRKRAFLPWDYVRRAGSREVDAPDGLVPPVCSECGAVCCFTPRVRAYSRGDREVTVRTGSWTCIHCADPFYGGRPFKFADVPLLQWNAEELRRVWRARFGEEMPRPRGAGSDVEPLVEPRRRVRGE